MIDDDITRFFSSLENDQEHEENETRVKVITKIIRSFGSIDDNKTTTFHRSRKLN